MIGVCVRARRGDPAGALVKLSAIIITRNEMANLPDCLASLSFCDEIVVVDQASTD
jgi:glycosyltransferase involved in cell wall biosynthesis